MKKLYTARRRSRLGQVARDMHYYVMKTDREFSPRLNREHSDFRWFTAKQLPCKFNVPTWIAIKNGLLEKVAKN